MNCGSIMQLVSYGSQDIYLTANPQITFFKTVYNRHKHHDEHHDDQHNKQYNEQYDEQYDEQYETKILSDDVVLNDETIILIVII